MFRAEYFAPINPEGPAVAPKVTALGMTVLATLSERPMHPYELYQLLLDRKENWLVKVRPGSLYHTIERLADDSLVEPIGTEREGRRPERTTYAITGAGRGVLKRRIAEIVSTPAYEYPVFPVALSELHELPMSEALVHLEQRVAGLEEQLAEVDAVLDQVREDGILEAYWFSGDFLRTQMHGEREWIRGLIERMRNGDVKWPEKTL